MPLTLWDKACDPRSFPPSSACRSPPPVWACHATFSSFPKHSVNFHTFLSFCSRDFPWPGMFPALSSLLKLWTQSSRPFKMHPPLWDPSQQFLSLLSNSGSASFSSLLTLYHQEGIQHIFVHVTCKSQKQQGLIYFKSTVLKLPAPWKLCIFWTKSGLNHPEK